MYGPVCTVVWEEGSRKAPPYPDWPSQGRPAGGRGVRRRAPGGERPAALPWVIAVGCRRPPTSVSDAVDIADDIRLLRLFLVAKPACMLDYFQNHFRISQQWPAKRG